MSRTAVTQFRYGPEDRITAVSSVFVFLQVEEGTQCMQSGNVLYNNREDTLLSLSIPMEAVLNKGEENEFSVFDPRCY